MEDIEALPSEVPDELVFAFVNAVGTKADPIREHLIEELKHSRYDVQFIKISDLFLDNLDRCEGLTIAKEPYASRVRSCMDVGNKLRQVTERADVGARLAIAIINQQRGDGGKLPRTRTAYIISSLKREEEATLLRDVYGVGFFLIGVYASEQERLLYLQTEKGVTEVEAKGFA